MGDKFKYHAFRKRKKRLKIFSVLTEGSHGHWCEEREKTGEISCMAGQASKSINILF